MLYCCASHTIGTQYEQKNIIYKIFLQGGMGMRYSQIGFFSGSVDDKRDGFIHMSTYNSVARDLIQTLSW